MRKERHLIERKLISAEKHKKQLEEIEEVHKLVIQEIQEIKVFSERLEKKEE
jgi:hypothetical protein